MGIVRVERHGPQAPGEYWWQAYDAAGVPCVSFWTADRDPQDLIDQATAALEEQVADAVYGVEREEPCVYGHFDCAEYDGGPCAYETYARKLAK